MNDKQKAMKALGLEDESVRQVTWELDWLQERGLLVRVTVSGISLLSKRTPPALHGLGDTEVRKALLSAGSIQTLPAAARKFRSLEMGVRASVEQYSTDLTGFRPYRFMSFEAVQDWLPVFKDYQERWNTLRGDVIKQLDEYRADAVDKWALAAMESWRGMVANAKAENPNTGIVSVGGRSWEIDDAGQERFVSEVVKRALASIPTREQIEANFHITFEVAQIKISEAVKATLATELLDEETKAFVLQQVRQQAASVSSPVQELIAQLRSEVEEQVKKAVQAIKRNDYLPGPSSASLKSYIDRWNKMSMGTDEELMELLGRVGEALESGVGGYTLEARLQNVLEACQVQAQPEPEAEVVEEAAGPQAPAVSSDDLSRWAEELDDSAIEEWQF